MRKVLSAALLLCIVALLSTLSTPVYATPRKTCMRAEGTWTYMPTVIKEWEAGGYTFRHGEEDSNWMGTFVGASYDVFIVKIHPAPAVRIDVVGLIFFDGKVNEEEGSLVILFVGKKTMWDEAKFWWSGKWMILSGTGDLANLRGQGTWWGPGFVPGVVVPGELWYSGWVYFRPIRKWC